MNLQITDTNLLLTSKPTSNIVCLTHEQLEIHGSLLCTVVSDALVLKHQAISIHSDDEIFIVLDQLHTETERVI